jgi:hypothetical protein
MAEVELEKEEEEEEVIAEEAEDAGSHTEAWRHIRRHKALALTSEPATQPSHDAQQQQQHQQQHQQMVASLDSAIDILVRRCMLDR